MKALLFALIFLPITALASNAPYAAYEGKYAYESTVLAYTTPEECPILKMYTGLKTVTLQAQNNPDIPHVVLFETASGVENYPIYRHFFESHNADYSQQIWSQSGDTDGNQNAQTHTYIWNKPEYHHQVFIITKMPDGGYEMGVEDYLYLERDKLKQACSFIIKAKKINE